MKRWFNQTWMRQSNSKTDRDVVDMSNAAQGTTELTSAAVISLPYV